MAYTPVKAATINLIHSGANNIKIAAALNQEFGIPGHESDFYDPINQCRAEIEAYRKEAPTLALEAFQRGYSWKQVVDGLEANGLLHSSELISICVRARKEASPKEVEPHVDDVLEQQRAMLDKLNQQSIAKALDLADKIEGTDDPLLQQGVDALRGLVDRNAEDRHDKKRRGELNGTIGKS